LVSTNPAARLEELKLARSQRIYVLVDGNISSMAKHTTRDQVWNAALEYVSEWEDLEVSERENRYGFTAPELIEAKELEATKKTVRDTLDTMSDMGWLRAIGGKGGNHTTFSR
jgi:hypothetical protein